MAQKIIIDTDIGTYYDDALAVSIGCQSPELELLGVTTVYGDTHLRSRIARKVLDVNGRPDVPVARGVGQPLGGNFLMFGFEGEGILEDGDGDLAYLDEPAPNFIIRNIMENPGEVTVVTLGAVSNMAVAYVLEPAIRENIKELIMMAGVIVPIVDEKGIPPLAGRGIQLQQRPRGGADRLQLRPADGALPHRRDAEGAAPRRSARGHQRLRPGRWRRW